MNKQEIFIQSLRQAGLRLTPQRLAICQVLADDPEHPSAQSIFEKLKPQYPSLSLTTVYNTLETLVNLGVINNLGKDQEGTARYDPNTAPHANLICISCNRIIDFESQHMLALDSDIKESSGYQIVGASVLYYGLCQDCRTHAVSAPDAHEQPN